MKKVTIDGEVYVKESDVNTDYDYVIVRSVNAGVFAGYLVSENNDIVELKEARKLYYWSGACAVEQLAVDGTTEPQSCKFTVAATQKILGVCQIVATTDKAKKSIQEVAEWKK